MSYKDALITSKAEAVQFLKREIAAAGVSNFEFKDEPSDEHFIVFQASVPESHEHKSGKILDLYMRRPPQQHLCFLDAVGVAEKYKGIGLGGATVKAALGIMHQLGAHVLLLRDVHLDGPSYWSYYGAVPAKEPRTLADEIQKALHKPDAKFNQKDRAIFEAAQEIAQSCPYHGWRALSQADGLSLEGKNVRHEIFDHFSHRDVDGLRIKEAFVLFPAEVSTRKILEKRLGKIPVFLRMTDIHPLEELLSKSPSTPSNIGPAREEDCRHASKPAQNYGHS